MEIKELKDNEIKEEHEKEIAESHRILGADIVMTPDGNIAVAIGCYSAVRKLEQLAGVESGYIEELAKKIISDPMKELGLEIAELHKKGIENAFDAFIESLSEKFAGGALKVHQLLKIFLKS